MPKRTKLGMVDDEDHTLASDFVDIVFDILGASDGQHLDLEYTDSAAIHRTSPPWVLLVEDDLDFSLALKLRLERSGVAVVRAFEGVRGVHEACTRPAEAIILDYNLPNGQGDFVLRRLKANPMTRDIPVIVVTGVRDQSLKQRMLSLGAASFYAKPVDFETLHEELKQHIDVLPLQTR